MFNTAKTVFIFSFVLILVLNCDNSETSLNEDLISTTTKTQKPNLPSEINVADKILINANIITMDLHFPKAEALAISADKILFVGSEADAMSLAGDNTVVIDVAGNTVLPGFVDAHNHLLSEAIVSGDKTLEEAQEYGLASGITSMGDMSVGPSVIEPLKSFNDNGLLKIRTSLYLSYSDACGRSLGNWYLDYPVNIDPSDMMRIPGVKIFTDGWTCSMLPAFTFSIPNASYQSPNGNLLVEPDRLYNSLAELQKNGYQAAVHALGDLAVENSLNAFDKLLSGKDNSLRHRMEHNMYIRPELLSRYGDIGVIPVIWDSKACFIENALSVHPNKIIETNNYVLEEKAHSWINPWRSLVDANPNLRVAYHSDESWGISTPFLDLYSLVTRNETLFFDNEYLCEAQDWLRGESLSVEEALRIMTMGSAYSLFMEEYIGSLEKGKFADLIVASDDPIQIKPEQLKDIEVLLTIVSGSAEYCGEQYGVYCQ
tara:strand:- start:824 stop:2281 length:1458 start_codon:yes stop_codon:yes gene_type:complete